MCKRAVIGLAVVMWGCGGGVEPAKQTVQEARGEALGPYRGACLSVPLEEAPVEESSSLNRELFSRPFVRQQARFRCCYEEMLKRRGEVGEIKVVYRLVLEGDETKRVEVEQSEGEPRDASFLGCLEAVVWQLDFPDVGPPKLKEEPVVEGEGPGEMPLPHQVDRESSKVMISYPMRFRPRPRA